MPTPVRFQFMDSIIIYATILFLRGKTHKHNRFNSFMGPKKKKKFNYYFFKKISDRYFFKNIKTIFKNKFIKIKKYFHIKKLDPFSY